MERSADNGIRFVRPPQLRRRGLLCPGMMVESITIAGREHFASAYCGPLHLLIAHEHLSRRRGLTSVEGLPDSTRENLTQTLTFVPAGRRFREWHDPDTGARIIYIHIHPSATALTAGRDIAVHPLAPRLHFHSSVLWQTVLKVKTLVDGEGVRSSQYGNALGVVLTHELVHDEHGVRHREGSDRGVAAAASRPARGRTPCRAASDLQARDARAAQSLPFLSLLPALVRTIAASISPASPRRAREDAARQSDAVDHRHRFGSRIW